MSTSFKNWYEENKEKLASDRKHKYETDPVYRLKVLSRSRKFRADHPPAPPPIGCDRDFEETAGDLGITVWTLREWRRKNYFPEPNLHAGKFYFSMPQVEQLLSLVSFFAKNGQRIRKDTKAGLDNVISSVFANW